MTTRRYDANIFSSEADPRRRRRLQQLFEQLRRARATLTCREKRLQRDARAVERLRKLIDRMDHRWRAVYAKLDW